ncbi:MAG: hypothetical protein ABSH38_07205 [Verrucomicrobiota bacterium]|jgi:hypothetical protein
MEDGESAARPLSASLIKYLADKKAGKGVYHEASCPMAEASWLQMSKDIRNPYMGKEMADCGELKNQPADFRNGMDGLAQVLQRQFNDGPMAGVSVVV